MKIASVIKRTIEELNQLKMMFDEEKFKKMYKEYVTLYPRLGRKPELRQLLTQMIKLYLHIEQLWHDIEGFYDSDIKEYQRMMKLMLKVMQEWERIMSRLGMTYTSQPYIPAEEKKTFDPKAVLKLTERIKEISQIVKQRIKETEAEAKLAEEQEKLVKQVKKKKKKKAADQ